MFYFLFRFSAYLFISYFLWMNRFNVFHFVNTCSYFTNTIGCLHAQHYICISLICILHISWMTVFFLLLQQPLTVELILNNIYLLLLIAIYVCVCWVVQRPDRNHVGGWRAAQPLLLSGGGQVEKMKGENSSDTLWTCKRWEIKNRRRE